MKITDEDKDLIRVIVLFFQFMWYRQQNCMQIITQYNRTVEAYGQAPALMPREPAHISHQNPVWIFIELITKSNARKILRHWQLPQIIRTLQELKELFSQQAQTDSIKGLGNPFDIENPRDFATLIALDTTRLAPVATDIISRQNLALKLTWWTEMQIDTALAITKEMMSQLWSTVEPTHLT